MIITHSFHFDFRADGHGVLCCIWFQNQSCVFRYMDRISWMFVSSQRFWMPKSQGKKISKMFSSFQMVHVDFYFLRRFEPEKPLHPAIICKTFFYALVGIRDLQIARPPPCVATSTINQLVNYTIPYEIKSVNTKSSRPLQPRALSLNVKLFLLFFAKYARHSIDRDEPRTA